MNSKEIIEYLIKNNSELVLATANKNGKPWVSPLSYIADEEGSFYWVSSKNAVHSKNIVSRKEAAITIFGKLKNGDTDGAYFEVEVFQLDTEEEARGGLKTYGKLEQPEKWVINSIEDITNDSVWRIYKAVVKKSYKRIDEVEEGRAVTARTDVEL